MTKQVREKQRERRKRELTDRAIKECYMWRYKERHRERVKMFLLSSLEHIGEMSVHKILMAIIRRFLTFGALKILCQTLERIPPTYLR